MTSKKSHSGGPSSLTAAVWRTTSGSGAGRSEVIHMSIHWQDQAAHRAGLSDDDMLCLSASSESGYDPSTVQRFLDALNKPPAAPAPQRPAPRVLYVGAEVDNIIKRHPQHFGRPEA